MESVLPGSGRALVAVAVTLTALAAALCFAARAQAAETILWNNYSGDPDSIGFAAPDGSGGGALNLGAAELDGPEGNAYDPITNRFFVANNGSSKIVAINLDGSGGAYFTAPGAPVESPEGLVVDPESRTMFWINTGPETISWARIDGSAGGVVATGGADVDAYRLSLDPVAKRLYWFDGTVGNIVSVSVAGGTVTPLNTTGATPGTSSSGVAVEPGLGKVFWLNGNDAAVSWASLAGTGGGDIPVAEPAMKGPYGLVVDAAAGRIYWANYSTSETRTNALGFLNLAGGFAPINVLTAPVDGPQDPVLIKLPTATAAPVVSRGTKAARSQFTCSGGTWAADAPGAFLYQSPRALAYQWTRGGAAIPGAVGTSLTATTPGKYACVVTATNQAGSTASTSATSMVKAAKFKLVVKTKKAKARVGQLATFTIQAANQGDLKSKNSRICVKLTKAQKKVLKQPKCKQLGKVVASKRKSTKLKVKVLPNAVGTYTLKLIPKGTGGKAAKAKLQVID